MSLCINCRWQEEPANLISRLPLRINAMHKTQSDHACFICVCTFYHLNLLRPRFDFPSRETAQSTSDGARAVFPDFRSEDWNCNLLLRLVNKWHSERQHQEESKPKLESAFWLLHFSKTLEFWMAEANCRLRFSLSSIILADFLGNSGSLYTRA